MIKIKELSMAIASTIVVACAFTSCINGSGEKAADKDTIRVEESVVVDDELVVYSVEEFNKVAETEVGGKLTVEGICSHICAHGARKIALTDPSGEFMVQGLAGATMDTFSYEAEGKTVQISGVVQESRIDEAYLKSWEAQLDAGTEEKHGNEEEEGGCSTEKKLRGEKVDANSSEGRIADFRARIAERMEKEGKDYLSFYNLKVESYKVIE